MGSLAAGAIPRIRPLTPAFLAAPNANDDGPCWGATAVVVSCCAACRARQRMTRPMVGHGRPRLVHHRRAPQKRRAKGDRALVRAALQVMAAVVFALLLCQPDGAHAAEREARLRVIWGAG